MRRRELLTGTAALALSAGTAHAFGLGRLGAGEGRLGGLGGAGASAGMPPAPPGFHWDFVIDSLNGNQSVTDSLNNNQRVVALVGN